MYKLSNNLTIYIFVIVVFLKLLLNVNIVVGSVFFFLPSTDISTIHFCCCFLVFFHVFLLEIATLTHKFTSVTLYKNKTVRYAARMHAIIACQMEFQLYPMDIQVCPIYIESCKY